MGNTNDRQAEADALTASSEDDILDSVCNYMVVALVLRAPSAARTIDAIAHGNVAHCELGFVVTCTRDETCWCARHTGFQASVKECDENGVKRVVNTRHYTSNAKHAISFTAYRHGSTDILQALARCGETPIGVSSGVVMRIEPYTGEAANNSDKYKYCRVRLPSTATMTSHERVRRTFKWCLAQCVDATDRRVWRHGGYAYARALLGAIAARFVTPSSRLGCCVRAHHQVPAYRSTWFCSEFVAAALIQHGLYEDEGGSIPPLVSTPSNLCEQLLACRHQDRLEWSLSLGREMVAISTSKEGG